MVLRLDGDWVSFEDYQSNLDKCHARIKELEGNEEKFRNFIRTNHLSAQWIEFINQTNP